jgi:hypothetical protein
MRSWLKTRFCLGLKNRKQTVYQLYGLVMLKCLNPIAANLLTELTYVDTLIDVSVADDVAANLQNSIHATLSFCTTMGFAPQINANSSADNIDKQQMRGVVFPRQLTISGKEQSELYIALKQLGSYLAPYDPPPSDTLLLDPESQEHADYIENIRDGLQNMETGEYGLLALSVSLHRGEQGGFPLLEELENLINKDYLNDKLTLPCVILRAESTVANGEKADLLFPHR